MSKRIQKDDFIDELLKQNDELREAILAKFEQVINKACVKDQALADRIAKVKADKKRN